MQASSASGLVTATGVAPLPTQLRIVGGGMAAHGLCRRLVEDGSLANCRISIFGDESRLAYDRVHLSKWFEDQAGDDALLLADRAWYRHHDVEFITGCRIVSIDRDQRRIIDQDGNQYPYDQLVLATGSYPFVPPVPGRDLEGVFVYRTIDDLNRIRDHVARRSAKIGAVIGGGLLGLEAAKILCDLGLKTSVIEMAPGLMPRQLDHDAAAKLKRHVESIGVDVHLVRRTESIESTDDGGLRLTFANADPMDVQILIIAAGVRPNDSLARQAGLAIGPRGGVVVDGRLQTSDPNIFAIGECCSFRDHVYGLVAPCFRMADVLADRFLGREASFDGADESAELKLLGMQVVTLGRAIGESAGGIVLAHGGTDSYRKVILENGCLVGAACVGDWDELPQVRQAIAKQARVWPMQRIRFRKTGLIWPAGSSLAVAQWPADAIVCSCIGVTRGQISGAIASGASDADSIRQATRASTACGSCHALVCELAGAAPITKSIPGTKSMLAASMVAAAMVVVFLVAPPISFATSVQDAWRNVDVLWRDDTARQVTGFSTLGLTLLGLVFSLRKRWDWFRFGSYAFWRAAHGVLGAAVLISVAVHTGLRMGENLNFILAVVFLSVAGLGALAGVASSMEAKSTGGRAIFIRKWRPRLTTLHLWLFWPLPALIAMHILSFYWFTD